MLFIDNKYTRTYYRIVGRAKTRVLDSYTEKHHIIPRSLGGTNLKENLVRLTAREHFICHLLLTKMTDGTNKRKMTYAVFCLMNFKNLFTKDRYTPTSRTFARLRKLYSESVSSNLSGRKRSEESKRKQSVTTTGRKLNPEHAAKVARSNRLRNFANIGKPAHNKGISGPMKGIPKTEEHKANMRKPKEVVNCPHCHKQGGISQMKRWHFSNCKIFTQSLVE